MITYENMITSNEYLMLRKAVGFALISEEQARRGLEHTTFLVAAKEDGKTVGMARVLFDYGYTAYIADVIVLPDCQGKGIGRSMVEQLIKFVKENADEGDYISYALMAAEGKEAFYEKLGFVKRPCDHLGAGMCLRLNDSNGVRP
jgi:GNAT superfamily N-acetyltransferase